MNERGFRRFNPQLGLGHGRMIRTDRDEDRVLFWGSYRKMDSALWELMERERSSERQNKGEERERERDTHGPRGVDFHPHSWDKFTGFFFFFICGLFYFTLLDGLCVKKKKPGSHAISSQTLTWTEAARMCLESTSLT